MADNHTEQKQLLVLRYRLGTLLFAREFAQTFGGHPGRLTTHFINISAENNPHSSDRSQSDSGECPVDIPKTLPPLSRQVYHRWVRAYPLFAGLGPDYLDILDQYTDAAYVELLRAWLRATKFDLLGFLKHYYAVFLFGYSEPHSHVDNSNDALASLTKPFDPAFVASITYSQYKAHIISSLAAFGSYSGRFTTVATSARDVHDRNRIDFPKDPARDRDPIQELRYRTLSSSFCDVLHQSAVILSEICPDLSITPTLPKPPISPSTTSKSFSSLTSSDIPFATALLSHFHSAPTLDTLRPDFIEWTHAICKALAVGFENVLDDPGWRGKARRVWNKIPVGILVTSLRIVNPIPFVETLLRIFVWKPPGGINSLLQSFAGVLCNLTSTKTTLKSLLLQFKDSKVRVDIESIIDTLVGSGETPGIGTTLPTDEIAILEALRNAGVDINDSYTDSMDHNKNLNTRYARAFLRLKEKQAFVDALGSDQVTGWIVHICKLLPPVLKELWTCVHMADLVQEFCNAVGDMLEIVGRYDKEEDVVLPSPTGASVFEPVVNRGKDEDDGSSIDSKGTTNSTTRSYMSFGTALFTSIYKKSPFSSSTPSLVTSKREANSTQLTDGSEPLRRHRSEISRETYTATIEKLQACVYKFSGAFYPILHELSQRNGPFAVGGLHHVIDWILKETAEGLNIPFEGSFAHARTEETGQGAIPSVNIKTERKGDKSKKRCLLDISLQDAANNAMQTVCAQSPNCEVQLRSQLDKICVGLLISGINESGWIHEDERDDGLSEYMVDAFRNEILEMNG